MTEEFFTLFGKHDFMSDDLPRASDKKKALAYRVPNLNNKYSYYVKVNNENNLFNPFGTFEQFKNQTAFDRNKKQFKEVNQKAFELYLSFLKTRNNVFLLQARREAI